MIVLRFLYCVSLLNNFLYFYIQKIEILFFQHIYDSLLKRNKKTKQRLTNSSNSSHLRLTSNTQTFKHLTKMQIASGLNMNSSVASANTMANCSSNKYFMEDKYPAEVNGIPYVPTDWNSIFISSLPAGFDNSDKLGYLIEVVLKLGSIKRIDFAKHGTTGKSLAFIHFNNWNNTTGIQKFRKDIESLGYVDLMGTHTFWTSSIEVNLRNNGNTESYSQLNRFFPDCVKPGTYLRMMINKNPVKDTVLNIHQIAANADELYEKVEQLEEELTSTKEELTSTKEELVTNNNLMREVMEKYTILANKLQYVMENFVPRQPILAKSFCDEYEPLSLDNLIITDNGPLTLNDLEITDDKEEGEEEDTIVNQDDKEKPANSEAEASVKKEEEVNNANSGEESTTKNSTETETKEKDEPSAAANIRDLEWAKIAKELLGDVNYKKHLIYQANRILLRLRQLRLSAMRMRIK